jgi:hypothetical protein
MARTVVGYIRQYLNNSASSVGTGSVEAVTGLPIATGGDVGNFTEFSDSEALAYSQPGIVSVNLLTAGSGQTAGTYTATANTGGAVIQYVVAAGGTITAQPTVVTPGGPYTDAAIPTFTIAAGGTPATVQAVIGVLYTGVYRKVQLDSAVTGTILPGTPLYWLQTSSGIVVTTTVTANFPDFAGVSIDPAFGAANPYAFIQCSGKCRVITKTTGIATYGDSVIISTDGLAFTGVAGTNPTTTGLTVGYGLVVTTAGSSGLIRITRYPSRF